jgi:hypothetical protein
MKFQATPIVAIPCQAVVYCAPYSEPTERQGSWLHGKQCPGAATRLVKGRAVCWCHYHAAKNPERTKPVEFVGDCG